MGRRPKIPPVAWQAATVKSGATLAVTGRRLVLAAVLGQAKSSKHKKRHFCGGPATVLLVGAPDNHKSDRRGVVTHH